MYIESCIRICGLAGTGHGVDVWVDIEVNVTFKERVYHEDSVL